MAHKITPDDTTLVLLLSDGTHRVTSWRNEVVDFPGVRKVIREQVESLKHQGKGHVIVHAFLACGQQHQQYSPGDCVELALQS